MAQPEVLQALRAAITGGQTLVLSASTDKPSSESQISLSDASYLHFSGSDGKPLVFPLSTITRFLVSDVPVDLRSIYFAWLNKDAGAADYITKLASLNSQLAGGKVLNIPFAERYDLKSWLEGQQDDSEYFKPLQTDSQGAAAASSANGVAGVKRPRELDPRIQDIYRGERTICDRNTILHGLKPTNFFSIQRELYSLFGAKKSRSGPSPFDPQNQAALVSNLKKPNQRPNPIILLSPSASSLLRLSNIKKFLEEGIYVPAGSELAATTGANRLHIMRHMPSIDPNRALQFVLMETSDSFRPDMWSRLVAVVTTGQEWQFKNYKWSTAHELFSRVLGIYVGFNGETVPDTVKKWGRMVRTMQVEKWNPVKGESGRWKDREVVEGIWAAVEESMRVKGFNKENGIK